jgi:hypothetical protein
VCWDTAQSFLYLKHSGGIATYFIPYRENVEWPSISEYPSIMPIYIATAFFAAFPSSYSPFSPMSDSGSNSSALPKPKSKRAFLSDGANWENSGPFGGSNNSREVTNLCGKDENLEAIDQITEIHMMSAYA